MSDARESEFLAKRDELAAGNGLPASVERSAGASRQWVSDELTESARAAAHDRSADAGRLERAWRGSLYGTAGAVLALAAGTGATAFWAGWTGARTAALVTAVLLGALLVGGAHLHRGAGGLLAVVTGEDNRLSTSRAVAVGWVLFLAYAVVFLAFRAEPVLQLRRDATLLAVAGAGCAVAVLTRRVVAVRVHAQRLQKVRARRPGAADLLCDDDGRASFGDVQYVLVNAAVLVFACARLAREPERLPGLPWALVVLAGVSALTYGAGKYAEGGRPVILSVVRAREAGDLDGPIRTGDDIEIRGTGFVPPGAGDPDRLTRLVARIGAVHVHVPLVPVEGGFTNPTDTSLVLPVPADVEPGRVEVQVVTAAGTESNRVAIDVLE
ncbi:hypothetical protein ABT160_31595 [Streptomyces sp. NPDC001941]|uniref:hypothetical protein n=1 Tax=Streptomyces sp. NPDC001941 TaxID=3154659 RepID=UPI003333B199